MPRILLKPTGPDDGGTMSSERIKPVNDILDWVSSIFGFQVTWSLNAFKQRFLSTSTSFLLHFLSTSTCFLLHLSDVVNY